MLRGPRDLETLSHVTLANPTRCRSVDFGVTLLQKMTNLHLNNIIIFSKNLADYVHYVRLVFQKLREVTLQIKIRKYEFFKRELTFLGYVIERDGIKTDSKKI